MDDFGVKGTNRLWVGAVAENCRPAFGTFQSLKRRKKVKEIVSKVGGVFKKTMTFFLW